MALNAEHKSKFAALHPQWWRLHMSEKFSSGMKNPKQTNKQNQPCINFSKIATCRVFYKSTKKCSVIK